MAVIFSCKNCVPPTRHVGCHSTCEKYLKEKSENDQIREKRQKEQSIKEAMISFNSNGTYFRGKSYKRNKNN